MSLFKKNILSQYNILNYKNEYLYLHCSKYDAVVAPFNGRLNTDGELVSGNKVLHFKNVKFDNLGAKVKAGDRIGTPIVSRYDGQLIANIGLMLTEGDMVLNVLKYLQRKDKDEEPKKKKKKVEETFTLKEVEEEIPISE